MGYETSTKRLILEKLMRPGAPSVTSISAEYGVDKTTVYRWLRLSGNGAMAGKGHKRKISLQEKHKTLLEAGRLSEEELGRWLRERGLSTDQLTLWRSEIDSALSEIDHRKPQNSEKEIRELQKELRRKDRALAEVSAILVLKKKLATILGEDSEP